MDPVPMDGAGHELPIISSALTASLLRSPLARARRARSVEAVPGAIPDARAIFAMETLVAVLSSSGADPLVVDRGREGPGPIPRTRPAVQQMLATGQSIVVRRAEGCDAGLSALAYEAAAVLGGSARVDLFVTPASGQSFAWRHEAEDLLIIQTGGEKDYFFRQNTQSVAAQGPLDFGAIENERSPLATCTLIAGDLLYVPRGWWHVAKARRESWSISIGLAPHRPF